MRWGISENAALEQNTIDICIEEIERCQKLSPKPNFIVLLGERYGWQPLPPSIHKDEFEKIVAFLKEYTQDRTEKDERNAIDELLNWYMLDKNAMPPTYILLNRSKVDQKTWTGIETKLLKILRTVVKQIGLSDADQEKYFLSATGYEIVKGALKSFGTGSDEENQVFCFFREIDEIEAYADIDHEKRKWLLHFKKRLKGKLRQNTFTYKTKIGKKKIVDQYLDKFCADVEESLTRAIEERLREISGEVSELVVERCLQKEFLHERVHSFVGRDNIIHDTLAYVQKPVSRALVLFGRRGVGKTSTAAKIADTLLQKLSGKYSIIYRFIGVTALSSTAFSLLKSICGEIHECYGKEVPQIYMYSDAIQQWQQSLKLASELRPLIIILDAVDQLLIADDEDELAWISGHLPEFVSLILVTRDGEFVKRVVNKLEAPIVDEIIPLDLAHAKNALEQWLSDNGRTLTQNQFDEVLIKFSENGLPLYLRFAFEQARKWRSFESKKLTPGMDGIIRDYFAFLSQDANHGTVLVSKALSYIAISKNGLSENELIEILSMDQSVMNDYLMRSPNAPKVETLPFIVWSRLYFDIVPYLKEVYVDNASLMQFYHLQVDDVVRDVYLQGGEAISLHKHLVDYFTAAEFYMRFNPNLPNFRKLSELSYHLMQANDITRLFNLSTDPVYMKAITDASRLHQLTDEMYWLHLNANDLAVSRQLAESLFTFVAGYNYELEKGTVDATDASGTACVSGEVDHAGKVHALETIDPDGMKTQKAIAKRMPILLEELHSLLIYKKNTGFYDLFFEIGRNQVRMSELCSTLDTEYIDRLHLDCLTKLLNYNRRIGDLNEAESLFREILPELERDPARVLDYSRALYDDGYIKYLQGKFDEAFAQMINSADISETGGNIVGKWISLCVGYYIQMISSLWTSCEDQYICEFKGILKEGLITFKEKSYVNSSAKRWIMNVNGHLFNVAFLENDIENANKSYIEFINDPWVKIYDDKNFVLPYQAKLHILNGEYNEACSLYQRYIDTIIVNSNINREKGIESFAEHYYWYGQCLSALGKVVEAQTVWQKGLQLSDEPGNHKWREKIFLEINKK